MKRSFVLALVFAAALSQAATIYQWDFNSNPPDGSTSTGTDVPSIAALPGAAISRIGGVGFGTTPYTSGVGSSDPNVDDNSAYHTAGYPAQGVDSGLAGIQVMASTVGYEKVRVSFDRRHSASASRWIQFQYTVDGTNFVPFADFEVPGTTLVMINNASVDLSSVSAVDNNPNFGFRLVSIFGIVGSAGGTQYTSVGNTTPGGSTYSANGTIRYDMVTIDAVPEPASIAALALGVASLARRRRR